MFCLRALCSQFRQPVHIAFIDLVKAYDKVDRDVLWLLLSRRGVPSNLINVIKGLQVGAQARVREAGQFSEAFPLLMGLKQGSVFAPLLFNIFFVAIILAIHHRLVEERVHFVRVQSKLSSDPFSIGTRV